MNKKIYNKTFIKRIMQIILCSLIVVIDVARNLGGWQIMFASQAIGLVMGGIIILHYGLKAFRKAYQLIWAALCGVAIAIMHIPSVRAMIPWHCWYECWLAAFNVCLFGMIITKMIVDDWKEYKITKTVKSMWKKESLLVLFWFAYILLATIVPDNTFRPGFYMLYFGVFYLVSFDKKEKEELSEDLSTGIIIGFWFFQILAFFFRPYVEELERYQGMYYNSNTYDLMCLVVMVFILQRITKVRREKGMKTWSYFAWVAQYAIVFSLIVLSVGRASIVLAVAGTVLYGVFTLIVFEHVTFRKILTSVVLWILMICLAFPVTFACASYLPRILKKPYSFQDEYYKWGDLNSEENYISFEEVMELSLGRFATLFIDYQEVNINSDDEEKIEELPLDPNWETATYYYDENNYDSVDLRVAIWRTYLEHLNLWGHKAVDWGVWVAPHEYILHAHNIFIMQLFVYGIPAGVLFAIWMLLYLIKSWKYMMHNKKTEQAMLPLFMLLLFIGYGLFDLNCMYGQISWTLVLFLQKYLFVEREKENGQNSGSDSLL